MMWCVIVLFFVVASQARHEQYEGHTLYRVAGPSDQFEYLEAYVDILSATPASIFISRKLEVLIGPYVLQIGLQESCSTEESDIIRSKAEADETNSTISRDTYYNTELIIKYVDELDKIHPDLVTVINAGISYEGRKIKYVRISTTRFENLRKRVIVIDAGVHARKWVTPPVALYLIQQFVEGADKTLTENLDGIIIPLGNLDGYEYSIDEKPANGLSLHVGGINMAIANDEVKLEKAQPYIVGNATNVLHFTSGTSRDCTSAVRIP